MEFDIYVESIMLDTTSGIPCYRVVLTDASMNNTYPFLAKFGDPQQAEKYMSEIAQILARFGGQYRQQSLDFKPN